MSKIFDLINELCPNGVEFVKLGEIADIGTGSSNRQDEDSNGKYPFYVRSKNILKSNTFEFDETAIIIPGEGGIGDIFHYIDGKYALHQRAYRICVFCKKMDTKFLYYIMCCHFKKYILAKSVGATATSIRKPMLENFKLPVPPMEVQREIVRILDSFTLLTAELTAELTARKKQYEFYRDFLLSFDELDKNGGGCELKMLGEILGYTQPANFIVNDTNYKEKFGIPVLTAGQSFLLGYTNETFGIYKALKNPTIIFDDFTTSFQWVDFDFKVKSSAIKILNNRDNQKTNFRFVYYAMRCIKFEPTNHERYWISKYSKIKIPVPSLQTQQKVVDILDKFDTLVNSITEGLPREIELRRKQYEHYRELLLNFKPKMTA
jgi:Restriction endonuclease S subunits